MYMYMYTYNVHVLPNTCTCTCNWRCSVLVINTCNNIIILLTYVLLQDVHGTLEV